MTSVQICEIGKFQNVTVIASTNEHRLILFVVVKKSTSLNYKAKYVFNTPDSRHPYEKFE